MEDEENILAVWGLLHGSIVGPEGSNKLGGGEVSKKSWLERIHIVQGSFRVIFSYSRLMGEGNRISVLRLGVYFQKQGGIDAVAVLRN